MFQSQDEYVIRIKKLALEDHEIPVALFDQRDSSYNTFGYIYLNVPAEFETEALKILNLANE